MASELYNTIDALSREKGIDPQIVVSAVEDAIVMATRKYYKTQENLRAELDKETGKINAYAVKTVVETPEQVEDPLLQITLEDARKSNPALEVGGELRIPKVTEGILGRIAAQLAKQVIFQKVGEAERDTFYNEDIGRGGERGGVGCGGGKSLQGPGGCSFPRCARSRTAFVPDRGAGDIRRHGGDSGNRSRSRGANEDRRHVKRQRCRRGGRLRRHERHARAVDHPRTAWRKNRHHRVSRRCGDFRRKSAPTGEGQQ